MHQFVAELYPICRSITGDGLRETLREIGRRVPLDIREVPTGAQVLDWTIPEEWNIRDAYVKDRTGRRVIDFQQHNLHVLNYSQPISETMSLEQLRPHLYSLPEQPELIPYRTSYYQKNWGFCLSHEQLLQLDDEPYEVEIDSTLASGSLSYGELYLPGATSEEVFFSCHVCHPSLANDNLSAVAVTTTLAEELARCPRRYSYRFLWAPGTIGAIAWLARNEKATTRIRHGLVAAGVGDAGPFTYKRSRQAAAEIDRAVEQVLRDAGEPHEIRDFSPYGYDERQYGSPGWNLPVGRLTRTPHGEYPEYHTSADNLEFVEAASLEQALSVYLQIVDVLETNRRYVNQQPKGEPQLGRRGLYAAIGGKTDIQQRQHAMLWVLNLSDGRHTLLDIAEKAKMHYGSIRDAAQLLLEHDLLATASDEDPHGGNCNV